MYKYLGALLVILSMILAGCGDSIYADAENSNSNKAQIDKLDFSFIGNDCSYISDYYDKQIDSGAVLDDESLYKYISAILACSGFDIVKGLDSILQTGGSDIYETASAIIGYKKVNVNIAKNLSEQYTKAINICDDYQAELAKDNLTLNDTNLTLCGLAGTMGTVVNLSDMLIEASGGGAEELVLTELGLEDFGQQPERPIMISTGLPSFLNQYPSFLANLDSGLILAENATKVVGDLLGQDDFSNVFGDLASQLRDQTTNAITEESLLVYIADSLAITIPDSVFPPVTNTPDNPDTTTP